MKKSVLSIVLCLLWAGFLPKISYAQQAESFSLAVFEERVSTADMPAFNKVQQETVDLWKKYNLDIPILCYATDDNAYFWVMPVRNFASLDTIFMKSAAFMKKANEAEGFDGSGFRDLSTANFSMLHYRPDLSYHHEGGVGQTTEEGYVEWSYCHMRQGHEVEAAAAIKKFIDFYRENGIDYDWDFYEVSLGYDVPLLIGMNQSTDPIAMRQTEQSLDEKYSDDFKEMWAEFAQHVRYIEIKTGWFKPKWSINLTE